MTGLSEIVQSVHSCGGIISATGGNINLRAPRPLPPELLSTIRTNKAALLVFLEPDNTAGAIPKEWQDGYAQLCRMARPDAYSAGEWLQLALDAKDFNQTWASRAAALGWTLTDIFGVHPTAPQARVNALGLVCMLRGKKVVAMTGHLAVLKTRTGAQQRYFRRKSAPGCPVKPLWEISQRE